MTLTTQRPVFVIYDDDVAPDELHPSGMPRGFQCESPSPDVAKQFHPHGRIMRYADGADYDARAVAREKREQAEADELRAAARKKGATKADKERAENAPDVPESLPGTTAVSGSDDALEHNRDLDAAAQQAAELDAQGDVERGDG